MSRKICLFLLQPVVVKINQRRPKKRIGKPQDIVEVQSLKARSDVGGTKGNTVKMEVNADIHYNENWIGRKGSSETPLY
tara:strand:- start:90 stop:326 length:237 start_codon:yes stop_codon:yes gene_type:complete